MAIVVSSKLAHLPAPGSRAETPRDTRFHVLLLVGAVALGAFLEISGPGWSRAILEEVKLDSFAGFGALVLALVCSILAHELGHLFAALFLNYELLGWTVGPLRFELWRNKTVVRIEKKNWWHCSISAVPREMRNGWRGRMMMVVAAGPAVSLLFLLASASVVLRAYSVPADASWAASFWSSCAEINLFLFILGLVPNSRHAAVRNDAALFLSLWQNNAESLDMFMCHQAIELSMRGIRPDWYPEPLLNELSNFQGRPYTNLVVARRMVEWASDSGNVPLATEWDRAAVAASEGCSPRLANAALAESACFDVLFREDLRSAVHKFAQVDFEDLFPPSLAERAWAARLIACDLPGRAPSHILRAQYHLPLGDPYYNYERMLLDKLHMKVLKQICPATL